MLALCLVSGPPFRHCLQNVLELTLYDKDILDNDQLALLLFDLRSLKPGLPHRHTFPISQQVSHPTWAVGSARGDEALGTGVSRSAWARPPRQTSSLLQPWKECKHSFPE